MLWGEIYEEITDRLNADGTFENSNNIRGYYIEFLLTRNVILNDNLSATITHDVEIDYSLPSDEQLQGKAALVSLLDSKDATATPTHNYQKIYVIAPEISGTIKYQKLANEQQLPSWNKAQNIANIPVHLLKKMVVLLLL